MCRRRILIHPSQLIAAHGLPPVDLLFGCSSSMAAVREKLARTAETTVPVLLQGESGTGKEVFAKLLHANSNRSKHPWVKVTCSAIPDSLIESELFGYEKGAFTGAYSTKRGRVEVAHLGTLFLDEVGSLNSSAQAKLLQVLQDGSFTRVGAHDARRIDTRLVCSANSDLRKQAEGGGLRLDFLFRINAITIDLPPLRERSEDLPALRDYFLDRYAKMYNVEPKPLSREIMKLMQQYDWPGNIRQLENMLRSHVLIGDEEVLAADLLPATRDDIVPEIDLANPISLKEITRAATQNLEREIILKVLRAQGWSRQKTARWLNISYRSLLYKLQGPQGSGVPRKRQIAASRSVVRSSTQSAMAQD